MKQTAIAIGAHPDDIEFYMAGTLLLLKHAGWEIHYFNLANGSCGSQVFNARQARKVRRAEAKRAAKVLGAQFHGFDRAVDRGVTRHEHDTATMADIGDRPQHIEPGDTRHVQIEEHQIRRMGGQLTQRVLAADRGGDVEAFLERDRAYQRQNRAVVVDDE